MFGPSHGSSKRYCWYRRRLLHVWQNQHPPTVPRLAVRTVDYGRRKLLVDIVEIVHRQPDLLEIACRLSEADEGRGVRFRDLLLFVQHGEDVRHRLEFGRRGAGRPEQVQHCTRLEFLGGFRSHLENCLCAPLHFGHANPQHLEPGNSAAGKSGLQNLHARSEPDDAEMVTLRQIGQPVHGHSRTQQLPGVSFRQKRGEPHHTVRAGRFDAVRRHGP